MKCYLDFRGRKMVFLCLLFCFININIQAQSWLGPHKDLQNEHFQTENSKPNPATYSEMIGVTGATNWDGLPDPNPISHFIPNARSFHLMEIDYGYVSNPNEYQVVPCTSECNAIPCYPDSSTDLPGPNSGASTFAYYKNRYCTKWEPYFNKVFASIESITPYFKNGENPDSGFVIRKYPDKWYTTEEWGGTPEKIRANAKHYAKNFAITFCPTDTNKTCLIDVLEIGNEPWGIPGPETYHAISRGIVDAFKEYYNSDDPADWRMKLSSGAFQADVYPSDLNDYIDLMVPADIIPYLDYISIHPYAFSPVNNKITEHPESQRGNFLRIKNFEEWRRQKAPHTKINVSEFGWNSKTPYPGNPGVGEIAQGTYLIRALLLMSRYGVDKSFIYELEDMPGVDLFNSTGILEKGYEPKKSFYALEKFMTRFGGLRFVKALLEEEEENGTHAYLLGNTNNEPTHLVVWNGTNINNTTSFPAFLSPQEIELPNCLEVAPDADFTYLYWNDVFDSSVEDDFIVQISRSSSHKVKVLANAIPIIIPLVNYGCRYNAAGEIDKIDLREPCKNITNPSVLIGQEEACKPYDPTPIKLILDAKGGQGAIEFVWQKSTTGPDEGWTALSNANSNRYDPPFINTTTWFRRLEKRKGCTKFLSSNVIVKKVDAYLCPPPMLEMSTQEDLVFQADAYGKAWVFWPEVSATTRCTANNNECVEVEPPFQSIGGIDGSSYIINNSKLTWQEAKKSCESIGAQLITINNMSENNWIRDKLTEVEVFDAFLGVSDEEQDGNYQWVYNKNTNFFNWSWRAVAKKGRTEYGYISVGEGGKWLLAPPSKKLPCLCEMSCQSGESPVRIIQSEGPENFSWLNVGQYEVAYYAFDDCGNFQRMTFKITVNPAEQSICEKEPPLGYTNLGIFESNRYLASEEEVEWPEAKYACEAEQGHLVVLTSAPENEWLAQKLRDEGLNTAFIGLSDEAVDGSMEWVNNENSGYSNWQDKIYPVNNMPDYIYMGNWNNGPWLVAPSVFARKKYICEIPCGSPLELRGQHPTTAKSTPEPIKLFPNPARTHLNLQLNGHNGIKWEIISFAGQTIQSGGIQPLTETLEITVDQLQSGYYLIKIDKEQHKPEVLKFVKY